MTVIARDQVAADHLVYAWPFPIGPECEVSCAEDEQVVMCPAWMVGDRLGPGRHRWRTPDPTRPVGAFFVLTAPVAVSFDMVTRFVLPNGAPMRLRASGSLHVRCGDPGLLVAQFVGLPFDNVNNGVLRSVSRSVERMLARLLIRRVVMSGTAISVTDGGMLPGIIEELIAYNPTAGAVFGVELIRLGHLVVAADDGSSPYLELPQQNLDWSGSIPRLPPEGTYPPASNGHAAESPRQHERPPTPVQPPPQVHGQTVRGMPAMTPPRAESEPVASGVISSGEITSGQISGQVSGEIQSRRASQPSGAVVSGELPSVVSGEISSGRPSASAAPIASSGSQAAVSGEIGGSRPAPQADAAGEIHRRAKTPTTPGVLPVVAAPPLPRKAPSSGPPPLPGLPSATPAKAAAPLPLPLPLPPPGKLPPSQVSGSQAAGAQAVVSGSIGEPKAPVDHEPLSTPLPGSLRATTADPAPEPPASRPAHHSPILGIGMGAIGGAEASPAPAASSSVAPGKRVLVPGPNGLMQSATVRQLLQGYYELEVGSSGETVWVPVNGVVPE